MNGRESGTLFKIKRFCLLLGCYGAVCILVSECEWCSGWGKGVIMGIGGTMLYEAWNILSARWRKRRKKWQKADF